jgi:hypothetical protein
MHALLPFRSLLQKESNDGQDPEMLESKAPVIAPALHPEIAAAKRRYIGFI